MKSRIQGENISLLKLQQLVLLDEEVMQHSGKHAPYLIQWDQI